MQTLCIISTLFVIGSLTGYVIELLYRRFVSQKRWMNPGFMVGPYIPLYGFGVILLFAISNIDLKEAGMPQWAETLILLAIIGVLMTLIELIAGLIFIRGLHLKLWDYSNRWGNFKGVICPLFSIIWFGAGALYYFFLNPLLVDAVKFISDYTIYNYFIGIVIGMMIVDFAYSLHLGFKIKQWSHNQIIKYEQFKTAISKGNQEKTKKKFFYPVHLLNKDNFNDVFEQYKVKEVPLKRWWKKKKENSDNNK